MRGSGTITGSKSPLSIARRRLFIVAVLRKRSIGLEKFRQHQRFFEFDCRKDKLPTALEGQDTRVANNNSHREYYRNNR